MNCLSAQIDVYTPNNNTEAVQNTKLKIYLLFQNSKNLKKKNNNYY